MTTLQIGRTGSEGWSPRTEALLAALCAVLFLDSMNAPVVAVALPSIPAHLGLSTSARQLLVSGYVLGCVSTADTSRQRATAATEQQLPEAAWTAAYQRPVPAPPVSALDHMLQPARPATS